MRDCIQCGAKHHHVCAIKVGQEEMSTKCAKCFKGDQSKGDKDINLEFARDVASGREGWKEWHARHPKVSYDVLCCADIELMLCCAGLC